MRQSLGVVARDVDRQTVGTCRKACILSVVFGHACVHHGLECACGLTPCRDHFLLKHFTGAVVGAGDKADDVCVGQISVKVGPFGVWVVDQLAVDQNLGAERVEQVGW